MTRLRDALDGAVSEDGRHRGARHRPVSGSSTSTPRCPRAPHPKQADLARHLAQLGAAAFRRRGLRRRHRPRFPRPRRVPAGRRPGAGEAAIAEASERIAELSHTDPAKAPSENVLAILSTAARKPGDLDALLLSEIVERLRRWRTAASSSGPSPRRRSELGLDADEAGLIAAAAAGSRTRSTPLRQQVSDELAPGRLRSAQRLAADLPADDPLRERIAAAAAEVAAIVRQADARTRPRP